MQYITPNVYFNCFFWFKVIFVQSIPCILVTIFNGCLLNALRKAKKVSFNHLLIQFFLILTSNQLFKIICFECPVHMLPLGSGKFVVKKSKIEENKQNNNNVNCFKCSILTCGNSYVNSDYASYNLIKVKFNLFFF